MTRPVNAAALEIAASSEGCVLVGYRDPAGIATAGYGHTGPDVVIGQSYSQAQADAWRQQDMDHAAQIVASHVTVPLTDNQFSALAEFTYNVGVGAFIRSTLLRRLNQGDYHAVPLQLMRWTKVQGRTLPGLVTRRTREAALFVTPVATRPPTLCRAAVTPPTLIERLRRWLSRVMA